MLKHHFVKDRVHFHGANWLGVPGRTFVASRHEMFPAPMFRCSFEYDGTGDPVAAISGAGFFELYINGQKVGDHVLDPGNSNFDKRVYYVLFDVKKYLRKGANMVGVILGNSTYNCDTKGPWLLAGITWRDYPKFILRIADGEKVWLTSSKHWQHHDEGPIRFDGIKHGEVYDARHEVKDWCMPGSPNDGWKDCTFAIIPAPGGTLTPQDFPPCRIYEAIQPEALPHLVFDLHNTISGFARIRVKGEAGAEVILRYGEILDDKGNLDTSNIDPYVQSGEFQTDHYIIKGSEDPEEWQPIFAYHGFRFIQVEIKGNAELIHIEACAISNLIKTEGELETSSKVLNTLQLHMMRSFRSNWVGYPTDCPSREKQGWTGDALCVAETGLYNFDILSSYNAWLQTVADTQRPSGQIAAKAPISAGGYNFATGPAWDGAMILIPEKIYRFTGDKTAITRHYDNMRVYMDYYLDMSEDYIAHYGLGDWCHPDTNWTVQPLTMISTGFGAAFADAISYISEVLGKPEEATHYRLLFDEIRAAFLRHFKTPDDGYGDNSPTALGLAVWFNLADNPAATVSRLYAMMKEFEWKAMFGILGAQAIPRVLSDYGHIDEACRIFTQNQYPGWAWQLDHDATCLWEYWHGKYSRNHIFFGDFSAWMYQYPGGIQFKRDMPGVPQLSPCFPSELNYFKATHKGLVSEWERDCCNIRYIVNVPENMDVVTAFPGKPKEKLAPGEHKFTFEVK